MNYDHSPVGGGYFPFSYKRQCMAECLLEACFGAASCHETHGVQDLRDLFGEVLAMRGSCWSKIWDPQNSTVIHGKGGYFVLLPC